MRRWLIMARASVIRFTGHRRDRLDSALIEMTNSMSTTMRAALKASRRPVAPDARPVSRAGGGVGVDAAARGMVAQAETEAWRWARAMSRSSATIGKGLSSTANGANSASRPLVTGSGLMTMTGV